MITVALASLALAGPSSRSILVFSRTQGFRHDSIPVGRAALTDMGIERGWTMTFSENLDAFKHLQNYDAIVFLSTTGKFLGKDEEKALVSFIHHGGGYIGIHAAADAEYDWPWYGQLVGAWFKRHPAQTNATVKIEDPKDAAMSHLPNPWTRWDEWYDYKVSPRGKVTVLASLDNASYKGSEMGTDHPIVWKHEFEGGRAFYSGLGHTQESYKDPLFLKMIAEGIEWACGSSKRRP